ncbi:MAG: N-acetylmuramoyl-L-alanine amidase [Acidobacteria bacterium]|nr:N-acetylmuramoyl-L-alanine amidase [Acidobacteriota bacterium]
MALQMTWVPSPNYTEGRYQNISRVIIHWMAGTLAGTDATFTNSVTETSAHYGIENDVVHQYVVESNTAWHSLAANPFSIGIEHSAAPGRLASSATYAKSIELCADICRRYGLTEADIEPHNKYVRTQCPGTIELERIKAGVALALRGEEMIENTQADWTRWSRLHRQATGKELPKERFDRDFVDQDVRRGIDLISNNDQADEDMYMADLGRRVTDEKWHQNILDLRADVTTLKESLGKEISTDAQKRLKAVKSKVDELAELVK